MRHEAARQFRDVLKLLVATEHWTVERGRGLDCHPSAPMLRYAVPEASVEVCCICLSASVAGLSNRELVTFYAPPPETCDNCLRTFPPADFVSKEGKKTPWCVSCRKDWAKSVHRQALLKAFNDEKALIEGRERAKESLHKVSRIFEDD